MVTAEKLIDVILRCIAGADRTAEVFGLDCNIVLTIAVRRWRVVTGMSRSCYLGV